MRRTKIVCTLGPASSTVPILKQLMAAGMDVARLNFSHGTHEEHAVTIAAARQAIAEQRCNLALLLDTKGPEIRIGTFAEGKIILQSGEHFTFITDEVIGNETGVHINYPGIIHDVEPGMKILLDGLFPK